MYNCAPIANRKIRIQTLTHGYQDFLIPDDFQIFMSKLSKQWNMKKLICYLDDLMMITNSSFKDYLHKLEMILARLSTNEIMI
jgi:hypothetical protein